MTRGGTPEGAELLRIALRQQQQRLHTALPGYVERVHTGDDRKGQWVDVLPAVRVQLEDDEGRPVEEDLPKLTMVPVGHIQAGGFLISVPIKVGDHVWVQFAERSLDQWVQKARRGTRQTVGPGHGELHGLNGAVAFPHGPATRADMLQDVDPDELVIGLDGDAGAQLRITPGGEIHLGGDAQFVALAQSVRNELDNIRTTMQAELNAIRAAYDAHTHITTATVGASETPGVIAPTAPPLGPTSVPAAGSVAASTTKAG